MGTLRRVGPSCRADWQRRYHANGAILSVAGNIDFDRIKSEVAKYFGDLKGQAVEPVKVTPPPGPFHHEKQKSEQTHMGIAYPSVPEMDAN